MRVLHLGLRKVSRSGKYPCIYLPKELDYLVGRKVFVTIEIPEGEE